MKKQIDFVKVGVMTVAMVEETLTDQSKVYNLEVGLPDSQTDDLNFPSEEAAEKAFGKFVEIARLLK